MRGSIGPSLTYAFWESMHPRQLISFLLAILIAAASSPAAAQTAQILPIGVVQGGVSDTDSATAHVSPLRDQTVTVQGVVTEVTLTRTATGGLNYGLFLQNTLRTADGDPNTSDGLFVFLGRAATIGEYRPRVGDELVLSGQVGEFFNLTQLERATLVNSVRSAVDLDQEVPAFEAQPPDDLGAALRYWERREGMRARVPAGSLVLGGRNVFPSTRDSEVWVARADSAIARRSDPLARRAFRDPHPLDDLPASLFDNGNGYRILLGNSGLAAMQAPGGDLLAPARTFDTVANELVGAVFYTFGKYRIEVTAQPILRHGVEPAGTSAPAADDGQPALTVASYNVENLYDFRDDPFDDCDFAGNPGCPGVRPPFDYVPESEAAYRAHLEGIARQITTDLDSPDLVLIQEAEDQDVCAVVDGALACGSSDNADGQLDSLQDLALAIIALGGPPYVAAADRDGADDRGIISAFLYRPDRVERQPVRPDHPVLGNAPRVSYRAEALAYNTDVQNPKVLNALLPEDVDRRTGTDGSNVFTRAPQVGLFRVWPAGVGIGASGDLYAVSNHFSSGPDTRVGQRREQAAYNAAIVDALRDSGRGVRVVLGGDLNVFPRPDDPFAPPDPRYPSDQLAALYEVGLMNLWERVVAEAPASAYSYVFQGQAQTLDQLFVNPALADELDTVRMVHINADWPADEPGAGARGMSDHDPPLARFRLSAGSPDGVGGPRQTK